MLTGTIDKVGDDFCVKYVTTFSTEPVQQIVWWKITQVERLSGSFGYPTQGDTVTRMSGPWVGSGYRAYVAGNAEPIKVEHVPVPCPKAGKKPTRWNDGRWEKLLARGWVSA